MTARNNKSIKPGSTVTIRITPANKALLYEYAKKTYRTASGVVEYALDLAIKSELVTPKKR